ncbi:hypothetical protein Tco_1055165 [Tanacetum coccineum]|uniref:Uncharacterized protein n=1 Tax=Tanacetum coccineum TaxID=301880 RepID=A0ABQ5GYU1_9ASTR
MESQSETTQTVSTLKLPILKTGDYDLWSMRMEQYLTHTDYALWEVIMNGDAPVIALASAGTEGPIPPKTAEQKLARKNELKAKSTLLLAIPDDHLLKFHGIKDAKTLWEAVKSRFGGNKESKKMQKTSLKKQYENFVASRSEGLYKTYDRFQKLVSQLEIHGEVISQEDTNLQSCLLHHPLSPTLPSTPTLSPAEPSREPMMRSPEDPQTPLVPQDEDEREPMFVQAHDPDYIHYAETPGYVTKVDPEGGEKWGGKKKRKGVGVGKKGRGGGKGGGVGGGGGGEDPEEYKDDGTEDGPVDYPIDGGYDRDDDDGDSSRDDAMRIRMRMRTRRTRTRRRST